MTPTLTLRNAQPAVDSWALGLCGAAMLVSCSAAIHAPQTPGPAPADPPQVTVLVDSNPSTMDLRLPESFAPKRYWLLGPFPKLPGDGEARESLDHDYLSELGGEAKARISDGTTLRHHSTSFQSSTGDVKDNVIDFTKYWGAEAPPPGTAPFTDNKVAYAYAEYELDAATEGAAQFGSDDAAKVWINGKLVHRVVRDRALNPDDDYFPVHLAAGKNRILVKVDNGYGGFGFALRFYDKAGAEQVQLIHARRGLWLLPRPVPYSFLLGDSLPRIVIDNTKEYQLVFGNQTPKVRWFGPDLEEVNSVGGNGRYLALVEATALDGHRFQRMLTFAKVPPNTTPWLAAPPYREYSLVPFPDDVRLSHTQKAELSRHIWAGGVESLWQGESSAIAALAFLRQQESRQESDEPAWLAGGFVENAQAQLDLRMKLESRRARRLPPPERLSAPAGVLDYGSERQAGMKPGTVGTLRAVANEWAKSDPHPFVVLAARRGVVFMHEGYNGFAKTSGFYPASIAKSVAGLLFARAVDQGLLGFDATLASVFPNWGTPTTSQLTFRHCFYHALGLSGHYSHRGLYNTYLDQSLLIQDALFLEHTKRFVYGGDELNLTGAALALTTGTTVFRLLYEQLQRPFAEPVTQFDLGAGAEFTAMYLAKLGQMLMQDGAYGEHRFYQPGFVKRLWPEAISKYAPDFEDKAVESGIGLTWMIDPPGPREQGVLGPNVVGHGAASGVLWRIAADHDLVIVVGRNGFKNGADNQRFGSKLVEAVARGLDN